MVAWLPGTPRKTVWTAEHRCPVQKIQIFEPLFSSAIIPPDALAVVDLFERALTRILIWAPTQELCAVPKSFAGHVIVANFGDKLGLKRLPLG